MQDRASARVFDRRTGVEPYRRAALSAGVRSSHANRAAVGALLELVAADATIGNETPRTFG